MILDFPDLRSPRVEILFENLKFVFVGSPPFDPSSRSSAHEPGLLFSCLPRLRRKLCELAVVISSYPTANTLRSQQKTSRQASREAEGEVGQPRLEARLTAVLSWWGMLAHQHRAEPDMETALEKSPLVMGDNMR